VPGDQVQIADEFERSFVEAANSLRVGDPFTLLVSTWAHDFFSRHSN
jgi:hypothetical protein